VNDLRVLEADEGFARVLRRVELYGRKRKERRRAVPSPAAVYRYLGAFHDAEEEAKRVAGKAFIPAPTEALKGLYRINRGLGSISGNSLQGGSHCLPAVEWEV